MVPEYKSKCSRIGPRAKAGKKVRAPTTSTTATSRTMNIRLSVPMVPWAGGEIFLDAMLPAIIITEIMVPKRASSIAKPPSRE